MNHPISQDEIAISLDYLKQLDSEISTLYHTLEDDESISEEQWKVYEKMLDRLFYIVGLIEKEFKI